MKFRFSQVPDLIKPLYFYRLSDSNSYLSLIMIYLGNRKRNRVYNIIYKQKSPLVSFLSHHRPLKC